MRSSKAPPAEQNRKGNFERGEIVSPVGCIANKVGKPKLVMPDARHRRPLKFLLYDQSVKTQGIAQDRATQLDSCSIAVAAGCFHSSLRDLVMLRPLFLQAAGRSMALTNKRSESLSKVATRKRAGVPMSSALQDQYPIRRTGTVIGSWSKSAGSDVRKRRTGNSRISSVTRVVPTGHYRRT
jgi:hypothetical protein